MSYPIRTALAALTAALFLPTAAQAGVPHTVQPGETLWTIAAANNFTTRSLAAANGLSEDSQVILGSTITIPSVGEAATALAQQQPAAQQGAPSASGGYLVKPGDTLSGIAASMGVSAQSLAAANGLDPTGWVIEGTTLRSPGSGTSASAPQTGSYSVRPGDSLTGIAASMGVSAQSLAAANGLDPMGWVIAGTTLKRPAAGTSTTAGPPPMGAYTVRPGDSLSGIAEAAGVAREQIAYMNGLDPDGYVVAGTLLKLPTGAHGPQESAPPPAQRVVPQAGPEPTSEFVSSQQIQQIAAQHGVSPSLASAIAYQESGFNNGMVSAANARGVMQIMPGTWDWINQNLAPNPLNPNSAVDNVQAGVLYLRQLVQDFGGDEQAATAAYYQGAGAVRDRGLFDDTKQYVNSVNALRGRFGG